jgi:hypothetical protein
MLGKAPPPFADRIRIGLEGLGDDLVLDPLGGGEHNPGPFRQALSRSPAPRQPL